MLCRRKGLAQYDDLLGRGERILRLRWFPGSRGLSPDVVQVVFAICPELWMPELPCLDACMSDSTAADRGEGWTYVSTIGSVPALLIVSDFVEVVLVELPHKAGEITVFEMLW